MDCEQGAEPEGKGDACASFDLGVKCQSGYDSIFLELKMELENIE